MNPKRLIDCFDNDGSFNDISYTRYRRRKHNAIATDELNQLVEDCDSIAESELQSIRQSRSRRSCQKRRHHMPMKRNHVGELVPIDPKDTIWWDLYVRSPKLDNRLFLNKFRR